MAIKKKLADTGGEILQWRVNTPALLQEIGIISVKGAGIMKIPLQIFGHVLSEVGERAAQINDPQLNALMCRLAIYEISDPYDPNYDKKKVDEILSKAEEMNKKAKK